MKKVNKQLLIFEILIVLIGFFSVFILNIFTQNNIHYISFWLLITAGLFLRFGFVKDKHLHKTDILQIVFIFSIVYLMIIYIFGLIVGFIQNPHSLNFIRMMQNIIPVVVIIFLQEISRYVVVTKGNKSNIILITLFLILMPIFIDIGVYDLSTSMGIFEAIGLLILPSIINNVLLTYIVIKAGYKPALIYRIFLALPIFIIPILPALGTYLESIFYLLLPTVLFLKLNSFFGKVELGLSKRINLKRKVTILPFVFLLLIIVALTSGMFRYYMVAVGSNSMYPQIVRGDAIIIQRLTSEDIENLQIGDVLVYMHDGRITIHRLIGIREINDVLFFQTKGDNNPVADDYYLREHQIEGIVRLRIPHLGVPAILLNQ